MRMQYGVLARRGRLDAVFPKTSIPGAGHMWFYSGRLQTILHDMQDARRMARGETEIRHEIPRVIAFPAQPNNPPVAENSQLAAPTAQGPASPCKAWPLCAVGAICTAAI